MMARGARAREYGVLDDAEAGRVKAMFDADAAARAADALVQTDDDGVRRRSRPADVVVALRRRQSNGMPEAETTDTIGKLWAWGFLDHGRFAPDLLRDAGRRYAAAYWFRFGPVCGKTGAYSDMRGGSGGVPSTVIPDEAKDVIAEERFRRRDDELRSLGRRAKTIVDELCVDGQGDNDPKWLVEEIDGYPQVTAAIRATIAKKEAALAGGTKQERRLAKRRLDNSRGDLARMLRDLRRDRVPHVVVASLVVSLDALAEIDRSEGLHKPKRKEKVSGGD